MVAPKALILSAFNRVKEFHDLIVAVVLVDEANQAESIVSGNAAVNDPPLTTRQSADLDVLRGTGLQSAGDHDASSLQSARDDSGRIQVVSATPV